MTDHHSENRAIERQLSGITLHGSWMCWRLANTPRSTGYSRFSLKNRGTTGHRAIYEYLMGSLRDDLTLDHLCRNRWCVNPNHLDPVTMRVNILRGASPSAVNARKVSCPKGHPYNAVKNSTGERYCLICGRNKLRRHRRARGAKPRRLVPYAEIARLRREGKSYKAIKRILHVTAGAIAQTVIRYELPKTRRLVQSIRITRTETPYED